MKVSTRCCTVVRMAGWFQYSLSAVVILAAASLSSTAQAVTIQTYGCFTVNFYETGESSGGYTSAESWTAEQMSDVEASIMAWDAGINNTAGRQIKMNLIWAELDPYGSTVLGGSSSNTTTSGGTLFNAGEHVWRDGWTGTVGSFDTLIAYDVTAAGASWNFGGDDPTSSQIDFRSVATHEIGHSLGFDSSYRQSTDKFGAALTTWDQHLVDDSGNRPAADSEGTPGDFNETDNPVYFDGAYSTAANGGSMVAVYAPSSFKEGSSLTHLDESTFGDALMGPHISHGEVVRSPTDLEWAVMKDMGWDVVPEPGTLIMLLGAVGIWLFRRRRRNA